MENIILSCDSYKAAHYLTYPPKTTYMFSYLESRGGRFPETVFFGLQYLLKKYLEQPVTMAMVDEARDFFALHGEPFNYEGWKRIAGLGYLPVKIRAVPEGLVVPTGNILMSVESTDAETFWVVSWLETLLLQLWYPITVATLSFNIKRLIMQYLEQTSDGNPAEEVLFKLQDFGARGVSSQESAAIGGAAHLVNFRGSDTVAGVLCANRYYDCKMSGFSIPATEHSTMTMWGGAAGEARAMANVVDCYAKKGRPFACVSDSYDIYNAVKNIWGGSLKQKVLDSGATLVVRPDSGHPPEVVLKCLELLEESFGVSYNKKMFKVLNPAVRVIQGDGVNEESIRQILETLKRHGYAATNVTFGMGGKLLQDMNRDTQKFAFKCSYARVNGSGVEVYKDPITDPGKRSKSGLLTLVERSGTYQTVREYDTFGSVMTDVYRNGKILRSYDFTSVRGLANSFL